MHVNGRDIIVIGTSAGGMEAVCKLIQQFPENMPASVFIVQHLSIDSNSQVLVQRLAKYTSLKVKVAENDEIIQSGRIYMVPEDRHMLLTSKRVLVAKGPRENQFRPAIDPLFRSAAAYHGAKVVGVLLTGMLSDGVIGLDLIKRCGGLVVVQDPEDAEYPEMPRSAINNVPVDFVVPLREMGALLYNLTRTPSDDSVSVPDDIQKEAAMVERIMTNSTMTSIQKMNELGERSNFSCPECGGALWEIKQGRIQRYRCHSGHAYNQESLFNSMDRALEETLWVSLRILEERHNMLSAMADSDKNKQQSRWAAMQQERADEMKVHIDRMKEILFNRHTNQTDMGNQDDSRAAG